MIKTYRIAVDHTHALRLVNGPMMTRDEAESYAAQMRFAGVPALVVNSASDQARIGPLRAFAY